jgi:hypothetical protein
VPIKKKFVILSGAKDLLFAGVRHPIILFSAN